MAISLSMDSDFKCGKCKGPLAAAERFCTACGADRDVEIQIESLERTKLASARKWILGVGIMYVVWALIMVTISKDTLTPEMRNFILIANGGLCVVHIGLYFWARKQALPAAVVALLLFASLHLVNAVLDPSTIYQGLLLKVVFTVVLVKAIMAGYEIHRLRNERA